MALDRIGHAFADQGLLAQALTHRSAGAPHNERLEFLGDSVVNLLVAETLFQRDVRRSPMLATAKSSSKYRKAAPIIPQPCIVGLFPHSSIMI